jgi:hypothetical protein
MKDEKRVGMTKPMKVGPGAYLAMAALYREKANLVRFTKALSSDERDKIAAMLEDAGRDYEETAKEMSGQATA